MINLLIYHSGVNIRVKILDHSFHEIRSNRSTIRETFQDFPWDPSGRTGLLNLVVPSSRNRFGVVQGLWYQGKWYTRSNYACVRMCDGVRLTLKDRYCRARKKIIGRIHFEPASQLSIIRLQFLKTWIFFLVSEGFQVPGTRYKRFLLIGNMYFYSPSMLPSLFSILAVYYRSKVKEVEYWRTLLF